MMNTASYKIAGGDYEAGGLASKSLKETLKKIGVDPQTIRRTMVAAYEAEMNVVIHARSGTMEVAVDSHQVDVAVTDEGPGIPDIELAMKEGYSTAPAQAHEYGFGAGMGLPNIRRNADRFSIRTTVGHGTVIRFAIWLQQERLGEEDNHSVAIAPNVCCQCLRCLRACPTSAIRIRDEEPLILDHLCIDCTLCSQACTEHAFGIDVPAEMPIPTDDTTLVLPAAFIEQFPTVARSTQVLDGLAELGFRNIRFVEEWETVLRNAVRTYADTGDHPRPVIAPMCPVVTNLIQIKFPSLIGHIAPFLTPLEAAREDLRVPRAIFAVTCPSQRSLLHTPSLLTRMETVSPVLLRNAVMALLASRAPLPELPSVESPQNESQGTGFLQVSGMRHVLRVLDDMENGRIGDYTLLELYGCDQGCFGAPIWLEAPHVARSRWMREREQIYAQINPPVADAIRRATKLEPRTGLRLDTDMSTAIEKLAQMDALMKVLPGRNCGVCGAPSCAALAEDVVLGRADARACVFRHMLEGDIT